VTFSNIGYRILRAFTFNIRRLIWSWKSFLDLGKILLVDEVRKHLNIDDVWENSLKSTFGLK